MENYDDHDLSYMLLLLVVIWLNWLACILLLLRWKFLI